MLQPSVKRIYNALIDLSLPIFNLSYEDGTYVIRDTHPEVTTEIINMLFYDVFNQSSTPFNIPMTYDENAIPEMELPDEQRKVSKKQTETWKYWMSVLKQVVMYLFAYSSDTPITSKDIINQATLRFDHVMQFLESDAQDTDQAIMFNQSLFDPARKEIQNEIFRANYKPSGMKGVGQCGRCKSERIHYVEKQVRGLDEPASYFYTCLDCDNKWRVG